MTRSGWARAALVACGLLLAAACSAHNDGGAATGAGAPASATAAPASTPATPAPPVTAHFTAGQQYIRLNPPAGQAAPTGPVEVVEVFSYGCPHCAEFAPFMDKLRAELPKGVEVRYMPAVFSQAWLPFAQAFYAAKDLGKVQQTHDAVFTAMLEHYPLNSLQDLADFYARHGVDKQQFLAAATSPATMKRLTDDQKTQIGWGIDATPTLVVGRRASAAAGAPFVAMMRSGEVSSYGELQQVGLWMAQQEAGQ